MSCKLIIRQFDSDTALVLESEEYLSKYKQISYDLRTAFECGINEHPQRQMAKLGYKVMGAVSQSMYDCWWFTVEDFIEPLPPYLKKIKYDYDYWHKDRAIVAEL